MESWKVIGGFAACLVLLAACSGMPKGGAKDFEVDMTAKGSDNVPDDDNEDLDDRSSDNDSTSGDAKTGNTTPGNETPPPTDPPKADAVAVKVAGDTFTIDSTEVWAEVSKPGEYYLFIRVTGPGAPAGSDFAISATSASIGCSIGGNHPTFRPKGDAQFMPATNDSKCGLVIDELPTTKDGRFRGTFKGTLRSINETPARTKSFDLAFDVGRKK
jgi:hypothetical protein